MHLIEQMFCLPGTPHSQWVVTSEIISTVRKWSNLCIQSGWTIFWKEVAASTLAHVSSLAWFMHWMHCLKCPWHTLEQLPGVHFVPTLHQKNLLHVICAFSWKGFQIPYWDFEMAKQPFFELMQRKPRQSFAFCDVSNAAHQWHCGTCVMCSHKFVKALLM